MKDNDSVIEEFNEVVNMTASELEKWLKSDDSQSAGWPKEDSEGESVGHDSGRKIVDILKANPDKKPSEYSEEQVQHMRKVVSYCKRHLAQEERTNAKKSTEEVKKTKSYASLKNWGHDCIKKRTQTNGGAKHAENGDKEEQAGDKRKATRNGDTNGASKKRETEKGKSDEGNKASTKSNGSRASRSKPNEKTQEDDEDEDADETSEEEDEEEESDNDGGGKKTSKGPKPGETVSWNYGNGQPEGKVLDVKGDKTSIKTKRGNEVTRHGDPKDPAVVLDTGKSKAIKSNHELN